MDQARSHLSPKGGQSPVVLAGDWPHEGALPAVMTGSGRQGGTRAACVGIAAGAGGGDGVGG